MADIRGRGETIKVEAGKTLVNEGDAPNFIYLVKKGELFVNLGDAKLGTIKEGDILGEISFLLKKNRTATVVAETDCELLKVESAAFDEILGEQPSWAREFITVIAKRIDETNQRIV